MQCTCVDYKDTLLTVYLLPSTMRPLSLGFLVFFDANQERSRPILKYHLGIYRSWDGNCAPPMPARGCKTYVRLLVPRSDALCSMQYFMKRQARTSTVIVDHRVLPSLAFHESGTAKTQLTIAIFHLIGVNSTVFNFSRFT